MTILKYAAKFLLCFVMMTFICTVVWDQAVNGWLYDCTDAIGFDYLHPGDWVHTWKEHPTVAVVETVIHNRSMNEPDTIKEGWTVARLWYVWYSMFAFSVLSSLVIASIRWRSKKSPAQIS